jgi:hypothetical protein
MFDGYGSTGTIEGAEDGSWLDTRGEINARDLFYGENYVNSAAKARTRRPPYSILHLIIMMIRGIQRGLAQCRVQSARCGPTKAHGA